MVCESSENDSLYNFIAPILTQCCGGGILPTGDWQLRGIANLLNVCVHGSLWIVDMLRRHSVCDPVLRAKALQVWRSDQSVFSPQDEINIRLRRLQCGQPPKTIYDQSPPCELAGALPSIANHAYPAAQPASQICFVASNPVGFPCVAKLS